MLLLKKVISPFFMPLSANILLALWAFFVCGRKVRGRWSGGRQEQEGRKSAVRSVRRALFPSSFSVVYGSNIEKPNQI